MNSRCLLLDHHMKRNALIGVKSVGPQVENKLPILSFVVSLR
ncbi:hypothetical protein GYH30_052390 [Glycine max]|nr:hypothetical protein GYH30_052390 [Glycine max]